jgi:hypothetical protein
VVDVGPALILDIVLFLSAPIVTDAGGASGERVRPARYVWRGTLELLKDAAEDLGLNPCQAQDAARRGAFGNAALSAQERTTVAARIAGK